MYRKNILFITQWFPSQRNPVTGIFIHEHAKAISQFHNVTILYIEGIKEKLSLPFSMEKAFKSNIPVFRLNYRKPPLPKTAWIIRINSTLRAVDEIQNQSGPFDIIHANIYNTADLAHYLRNRLNIPAILSEHSSAYSRNLFRKTQILKNLYYMNRLNLIAPVCNFLSIAIRQYRINTPMIVVPNTVDTNLFYPPKEREPKSNDVKILTVANLNPNKGIDLLIHSIGRLDTPGIEKVTIVGDGPEINNLTKLRDQYRLNDLIEFVGFQSKETISDRMRQCNFFVLPSYSENQPVVIIEAMASGLPVLATNVGGIPEMLSKECGLLIPPGDIGALTDGLRQMIHIHNKFSPSVIRSYAINEYSYEAVGNQFNDIYSRLIETA